MKGFSFCRLNHDVKNIIEMKVFLHRLKNTNKEYHQVFYFFNVGWDYTCPNPHGRCVGRWQNVTIHWLNGQRHREQGPAVEWPNGTKEWYFKGQLHRKDGPAVESANGEKFWYVHGWYIGDKRIKFK